MQRIFTILLSFSLTIVALDSCKKPTNGWTQGAFTGCRISRITEIPADTSSYASGRTVYNFYYNDDGTVHHMYIFVPQYQYSSYYKYFTYGNGFIATRTANVEQNSTTVSDSLILDSENRVFRIPKAYYAYYSYSGAQSDSFFYDSLGQLYLHTLNNYGAFFADTLVWQNGDLITDTKFQTGYSGGVSDVYNFTYADTLYNTGNNTVSLKDFESYGRSIYRNKHLLREAYVHDTYNGDSVKTYSYTLDAGGRITGIYETVTGGAVNTTKVEYECH